VDVSQSHLLEDKKVIEINKTITLTNGEPVTIQQVVTTPVSTTVYYDLSQSTTEDIHFNIQLEDAKEEIFSESFASNELGNVSYTRFKGLTLDDNNYYLVAYDCEDNQLSESIPIN